MKIRLIVPNVPTIRDTVAAYGPAIADIAGGFTATQATGGWKDDSGRLIVEPVTVFDCHFTRGIFLVKFYDLARKIARELHQDCVYLEIDGVVHYVKA
jgi:hypothetical protein